MALRIFKALDEGGISALWSDIVLEVGKGVQQVQTWANSTFVKSVNGKTGSSITLTKSDIGLGNVDNTADANKHVASADSATDATKLGGKAAGDYMLKDDHEQFELVTADALNDLEHRKVNKVSGKGLSTNDYTTEEKEKLAGIEDGAEANSVTSVAGKTGAVTLGTSDISGLQTALDGKQDNLSFTSAPSDTNKVVTKQELDAAVAGASNYLGLIDAVSDMSTTAKKGDFYRVRTAWDTGVHIGDIVIAEKDSPLQSIDGTNWALLHNELNTDTTYEFTGGTDKFTAKASTGNEQDVSVAVTKVNGHSVDSNVPADAVFTDTHDTNSAGTGIAVSGTRGSTISLSEDTQTTLADAESDHTKLGGHSIWKDVPSDAVFTDTHDTNVAGTGIAVDGERGCTISLSEATQTTLSDAATDHTNLGGHSVGTDVPSNAKFTDTSTSYGGHYTPAADASAKINPDESFYYVDDDGQTKLFVRDDRDMTFVGAIIRDAKGHVVGGDTYAVQALTDAEIHDIIVEASNTIAAQQSQS